MSPGNIHDAIDRDTRAISLSLVNADGSFVDFLVNTRSVTGWQVENIDHPIMHVPAGAFHIFASTLCGWGVTITQWQ